MYFEYEITEDEYVAAQRLFNQAKVGRGLQVNALIWIFTGLFFVLVAWSERRFGWSVVLLIAAGTLQVLVGFQGFFPARKFRRSYRSSNMAGKKFKAEVNEAGFEVNADLSGYSVKWAGVKFRGEDDRVFMFYSAPVVFIFGKKYLSSDQQTELRRLAGTKPASVV